MQSIILGSNDIASLITKGYIVSGKLIISISKSVKEFTYKS